MGKIYILGSINMDVVVRTPRSPEAGETLFGHDVQFIPGGKGANQAVAAGRLAGGAALIGRVGQDSFGDTLIDFLATENLDLHIPRSTDAPTGTALITVDDESENRIIVVSGSNMLVSPADLDDLAFKQDDILVSVFEVPQETIRRAFEMARNSGARTILNPAPAAPFIDGLKTLCDVLVVNETELAYFNGEDSGDLTHQLRAFRAEDDQTVIATLGASGAVVLSGNEIIQVPGRAVKAVDTTGAGDCFVGALAVAMMEGKALAEAVAFANTAASLSVQKLGASVSLPYRSAVDELLGP